MNWVFGTKIACEGVDYVVTVRDLPEVCTSGDTLAQAQELAADAIDAVVAHRIEQGKDMSPPSPVLASEYAIELPLQTAAKATLYCLWRMSGISKSELARRMSVRETEVRRILDPRHGTRPAALEATAKAMGYSLSVSARPLTD